MAFLFISVLVAFTFGQSFCQCECYIFATRTCTALRDDDDVM